MKPEGNVDKTYTTGAKDFIAKEKRKSKRPDDADFVSQPKKTQFVVNQRKEKSKEKRGCNEKEKRLGQLKAIKKDSFSWFKGF